MITILPGVSLGSVRNSSMCAVPFADSSESKLRVELWLRELICGQNVSHGQDGSGNFKLYCHLFSLFVGWGGWVLTGPLMRHCGKCPYRYGLPRDIHADWLNQ